MQAIQVLQIQLQLQIKKLVANVKGTRKMDKEQAKDWGIMIKRNELCQFGQIVL